MNHPFEEEKTTVIEKMVQMLHKKIDSKEMLLAAEFVRQFFGTVSFDDLKDWPLDDLVGLAVHFWALIEHRKPQETKIRLYHPEHQRDGWQASVTVIEVLCDDRPFLVDTLRILLNRMNCAVHFAIHMGGLCLNRSGENHLAAIYPFQEELPAHVKIEAPILLMIDMQTDLNVIQKLESNIRLVLEENEAVVNDWVFMRQKLCSSIEDLAALPAACDRDEIEETKAFLNWMEDHHFTFLGIQDYQLKRNKDMVLEPIKENSWGIFRKDPSLAQSILLNALPPRVVESFLSKKLLMISKSDIVSNIHRDTYADCIGIKFFNALGEVSGERRIIGLYTSAAYHTNPKQIPFLRHKVASILTHSKLNPRGHSGKVLMNILETLPRDDLIQGSEEELLMIAMGIFYMQERRKIRLFSRIDLYQNYVSCLVYVPKDQYNTDLRREIETLLLQRLHGHEISFSTYFSESVLARLHFMVRISPKNQHDYDFKDIESELIKIGRTWLDNFQYHLIEAYGEEQGLLLFTKYKNAFPVAYTTQFTPRTAVSDIKFLEKLTDTDHSLDLNFYRLMNEPKENFRLKIYQKEVTTNLSDVLPIIENLGLRAISERPYLIKLDDGKKIWIDEFSMNYLHPRKFQLDEIKELFQDVFLKSWFGDAENDGFNQLILAAGMNWRQVAVFRMYAKYFKQTGLTFSQDYIESALINQVEIAIYLIQYFELRFNPQEIPSREAQMQALIQKIESALDGVSNLDEDKIIKQYLHGMTATLRTNYYQYDPETHPVSYLSIKINSKAIIGIPKPYPLYEIFVYAPQFEGIHLRAAKVARGGLRWSDRKEDFRTEILGLMKAQQVKNSVIVPSGAKGGFVVKKMMPDASREEILAEGIRAYKNFIRGLLDITDNIIAEKIIKPRFVVSYDEDDPYLVVAADKGTATFSDIANGISIDYGFWLKDAFASGGSVGYDHKKIGITAKGAWESVKRHFYQVNQDIQSTDFTVVGIGDLSGDVFGNGMLLSSHIKLLAAFNHLHIFIDPAPSALHSFQERQRLFALSRSAWSDYDASLISSGGGVFSRSAKAIAVSPEMAELFGIAEKSIEPNELIKVILRAKVDLLWSAGIGTFIKAHHESNAEVGDRTNDMIRVDGRDLQAKVVGEGGNLGMTQLARVEYALNNGQIFTDFIDNSAGVSCSDKEVNIKILLNAMLESGDLTEKQRQELLAQMTDEVAALVLRENYLQTRAIGLMSSQALRAIELHARYISMLEKTGRIDRGLEYLPNDKTLLNRKILGMGLTTPEISVLICYSKNILKTEILSSDIPEEPYLESLLIDYFPKPLHQRCRDAMQSHRLKREIIATKIANLVVNEMGFSFIYRLTDETGAPMSSAIRAYLIARTVLGMDAIWTQLEALDGSISAEVQNELMIVYVRLLRRICRWFLTNHRMALDLAEIISRYEPGIALLKKAMPKKIGAVNQEKYESSLKAYQAKDIPLPLAKELSLTPILFAAMDIIEVAHQLSKDIAEVAEAYFGVGEFLDLTWIRIKIIIHPSENHWEALSRESLRDDLDWQQCQLAASIVASPGQKAAFKDILKIWSEAHAAFILRWRDVLADLRAASVLNYMMFYVAVRELLDLTKMIINHKGPS